MGKSGWICLHRKVLDNPTVTQSSDAFYLWMWLLLSAAHENRITYFNGERYAIGPGQVVVSRRQLAADLGISEAKIRAALNSFQNDGLIRPQNAHKSTVITILSWEKYQQVNPQKTHKSPTENPSTYIKTNKQLNNKTRTPRDSCYCSDFSGPVDDDAQALLKLLMDMKGEDEP